MKEINQKECEGMASRNVGVTSNSIPWYKAGDPEAQQIAEEISDALNKNQIFVTGATRSADDYKIDFEGHISPEVLHYFGQYMHEHRVQVDGNIRASDNWTEGIPMHKYLKSLLRHTFDLWRAWRGTETYNPDTGKPQTIGSLGAAILFNVQGMLFELLKSGLENNTVISKGTRQAIERGEKP